MRKEVTQLSNNFITCRLQGRTGNIMFQIAHAYSKALEHNRQFTVPSEESSTGHQEHNLYRKISFGLKTSTEHPNIEQKWGKFTYEPIEPSEVNPTAFCGWYQSEKYFGKYSEAIRDLFSPPKRFVDRALSEYPFFKTSTVAALNVRRGDYLTQPTRHPVVSVEYILEAYKHLPNHDILLVMSDDPEWCIQNIKLPNMVVSDNSKFWDADGLWLLSLCDHFIISNSTFSWWGAWLSRTDNKVVIAPSTWFGPGMDKELDPVDIYCEDWVKIPTYYDDGYIKLGANG